MTLTEPGIKEGPLEHNHPECVWRQYHKTNAQEYCSDKLQARPCLQTFLVKGKFQFYDWFGCDSAYSKCQWVFVNCRSMQQTSWGRCFVFARFCFQYLYFSACFCAANVLLISWNQVNMSLHCLLRLCLGQQAAGLAVAAPPGLAMMARCSAKPLSSIQARRHKDGSRRWAHEERERDRDRERQRYSHSDVGIEWWTCRTDM